MRPSVGSEFNRVIDLITHSQTWLGSVGLLVYQTRASAVGHRQRAALSLLLSLADDYIILCAQLTLAYM